MPRQPAAVAARARNAGPMRHRLEPRGGSRKLSDELAEEIECLGCSHSDRLGHHVECPLFVSHESER
jgi:hypothetical protein